jgi:hypothetical protein
MGSQSWYRFHGIEPRLGLTYSSEGRNGFVGVGWTLSGFSTIERVNSGRGAAFFNESDVYLLDGQKLLTCPTPGASASCANGGTHSTEIESYLKIVRSGDNWTVYGKDGTKTAFSPIYVVPSSYYLPGGILRWGQTSVTDTHGNVVTYVWATAGGDPPTSTLGDVYPRLVQYNGYEIRIFREERPDPVNLSDATGFAPGPPTINPQFCYLFGNHGCPGGTPSFTDSTTVTGRPGSPNGVFVKGPFGFFVALVDILLGGMGPGGVGHGGGGIPEPTGLAGKPNWIPGSSGPQGGPPSVIPPPVTPTPTPTPTPGPTTPIGTPSPCQRAGTCGAGNGQPTSVLDSPVLNMLTQQETGQSAREFLADAPTEIALSVILGGRFAKAGRLTRVIPLRWRTTHLYSLWKANADGSRGEILEMGDQLVSLDPISQVVSPREGPSTRSQGSAR